MDQRLGPGVSSLISACFFGLGRERGSRFRNHQNRGRGWWSVQVKLFWSPFFSIDLLVVLPLFNFRYGCVFYRFFSWWWIFRSLRDEWEDSTISTGNTWSGWIVACLFPHAEEPWRPMDWEHHGGPCAQSSAVRAEHRQGRMCLGGKPNEQSVGFPGHVSPVSPVSRRFREC